jgi:hypothetical protein
MEVGKQGRHEQRAPADERPWSLIDLLWGLTGDVERAYIFIEIIACTILILCTPACLTIDAVSLAAKGMQGLAVGTLLPSGFCGAGWLTYLAIRITRRLTRRRRRKPVPPPISRHEPSPQPAGSRQPHQSSRSRR